MKAEQQLKKLINILSNPEHAGYARQNNLTVGRGITIELGGDEPIIINGEITSPFIGSIFNDKFKSFSLLAIISLLNESIYEQVIINDLFVSVKNLINLIIKNKNWLIHFCEWLLYLLKLLGYEIDYKNNLEMQYFNLDSLNFQHKSNNSNLILFPQELLKGKRRLKKRLRKTDCQMNGWVTKAMWMLEMSSGKCWKILQIILLINLIQ